MNADTPTDAEIVEALDPDWRDHFRDVEHAAGHYYRLAPEAWDEAIRFLRDGK